MGNRERSGRAPDLPALLVEHHQKSIATLVQFEADTDTALPVLQHDSSTRATTQTDDRRTVRIDPHTDG